MAWLRLLCWLSLRAQTDSKALLSEQLHSMLKVLSVGVYVRYHSTPTFSLSQQYSTTPGNLEVHATAACAGCSH
jgi:hypothetical protein